MKVAYSWWAYSCLIFVCGRVYTTNDPVPTIDAKKVLVGTAPWNVGIYRLNKDNNIDYDLICGGSIIASNLVISGREMGEGDSGAGLTFLHSKFYYLTGVLSLKVKSSNNSIAVFTDIKYHVQWIR